MHLRPCNSSPVGFATLRFLLRALDFFDNTDCLMVFAICVPSLGWLRLMLIPTLNTSDRTRTAWATARHAGHQHLAGFNPNLFSVYGMQRLKTWSQPARSGSGGNRRAGYPRDLGASTSRQLTGSRFKRRKKDVIVTAHDRFLIQILFDLLLYERLQQFVLAQVHLRDTAG